MSTAYTKERDLIRRLADYIDSTFYGVDTLPDDHGARLLVEEARAALKAAEGSKHG